MKLSEYVGMNAKTGAVFSGIEHLRQSILDILTTRRGERVMRPEYGSDLFKMIDRPINQEFIADLYYEIIVSVHRFEPRVRVVKVRADIKSAGRVFIDMIVRIDGATYPINTLDIIL